MTTDIPPLRELIEQEDDWRGQVVQILQESARKPHCEYCGCDSPGLVLTGQYTTGSFVPVFGSCDRCAEQAADWLVHPHRGDELYVHVMCPACVSELRRKLAARF
jgi:hypothetical protein